MSITSSFRVDDSKALARRFALMTANFVDNPPNPEVDPTALVPLENSFRLLEMFRYDAFSDENREGVLAMNTPDQNYNVQVEAEPWHQHILEALQAALHEAYNDQPKDDAIVELQAGICGLVKHQQLAVDVANRTRTFFTALHTQLS